MNIRSYWFEVDDDENQEEEIRKKSRRTKIDKVAGDIHMRGFYAKIYLELNLRGSALFI
ncbi:MAG: hypothetical protein M3114_09410 [Thermoproteota archaeon]|nr:hypothetical protein [Thermoproteota archaeon]